jgi:hypothetical protein
MITVLDIGINQALAFELSGKITEQDMTLLLSAAKEKIQRYGDIVIFEKVLSFKGVELAALVEEFKYLYHMGLSHISKVAILTDQSWMAPIVALEDQLFTEVAMQCFALDNYDGAIDFLRSNTAT